jgi:glycyl-tRNA synthetase beta chain
MKHCDFLLEVGVEELPLASLDVIYQELGKKVREALVAQLFTFDDVYVEATPRRIALGIKSLLIQQPDRKEESKGPMLDKAYDASGKPTKALEGFLKSKEVTLNDIMIKELPKGKAVYVVQELKGQSVQQILPELITTVFKNLSFPKLMRWEASGFKFPRPVRWIVALVDDVVLEGFKLAGIQADRKSYGHRFLAPQSFVINNANWKTYNDALKKAEVVLSLEERENMILTDLKSQLQQNKVDEELLHLSAQLIEKPFLMKGNFKESYLKLPAEVLATCMKKHQKIFAYYDSKGILQNHFMAILNGERKGLDRIQFDYENVLESRLHDARYFYEEDLKTPLAKHLDALKELKYLGDLGSMHDKVLRLKEISSIFVKQTGHEDNLKDLTRVIELAKNDLMTGLVYEFPEIQGIAGREYALKNGENQIVAQAIATQYLPKNLFEDYENLAQLMNPVGALYGVLDRFDLITGAFALGMEPTGSQDPYALRRAAGSIAKIVRAHEIHFSISVMIQSLMKIYGKINLTKKEEAVTVESVSSKMNKFFRDRLIFELKLQPGTMDYELFEAVWKTNSDDLADVYSRYSSLIKIEKEHGDQIVLAGKIVERTNNILKAVKSEIGAVDKSLLEAPEEKKLFELIDKTEKTLNQKMDNREFSQATRLFCDTFFEPVNQFFDHVMVNVEDVKVRENRQALMKSINSLYTARFADLSVLSKLDK